MSTPVEKMKLRLNIIIIIVAIVIISIIGAVFFFQNTKVERSEISVPVSWKTYIDKTGIFSFKYPQDWKVEVWIGDVGNVTEMSASLKSPVIEAENATYECEFEAFSSGLKQNRGCSFLTTEYSEDGSIFVIPTADDKKIQEGISSHIFSTLKVKRI